MVPIQVVSLCLVNQTEVKNTIDVCLVSSCDGETSWTSFVVDGHVPVGPVM